MASETDREEKTTISTKHTLIHTRVWARARNGNCWVPNIFRSAIRLLLLWLWIFVFFFPLIFVRNHCVLFYTRCVYVLLCFLLFLCGNCCCSSFSTRYCFLILSLKLFLCTFDLDSFEAISLIQVTVCVRICVWTWMNMTERKWEKEREWATENAHSTQQVERKSSVQLTSPISDAVL